MGRLVKNNRHSLISVMNTSESEPIYTLFSSISSCLYEHFLRCNQFSFSSFNILPF